MSNGFYPTHRQAEMLDQLKRAEQPFHGWRGPMSMVATSIIRRGWMVREGERGWKITKQGRIALERYEAWDLGRALRKTLERAPRRTS